MFNVCIAINSHSNGTFSPISKLVNSSASSSVNVPKPFSEALLIFVNNASENGFVVQLGTKTVT